MSEVPGVEVRLDTRAERTLRAVVWLVLMTSWMVAVAYMWDALTTASSADRLATARMAEIPTPRTFVAAAVFSGMELAVVLALLWPWQPSFYGARLGVTGLALITWFIMTTPMSVSRMDWVHRRWLAFMAAVVAAGFAVLMLYRVARRLRSV